MRFHPPRLPACLFGAFLLLCVTAPAHAQVSGDLTLQSDYRLRGHSLSSGQPVGILDLAYDHPRGFYANGAVIGVMRDGQLSLLGMTGNLGYARRLSPELSLDGGFMRSEYRESFGYDRIYSLDYNEYYAGLYTHDISAHLYYSPNYYYRGVETLYGELEAARELDDKVRLSAHVGLLDYLATPAGRYKPRNQYDWRVAASRQFGPIDLRAGLSGGGPGPDYYDYRPHDRTALVVSASWTF